MCKDMRGYRAAPQDKESKQGKVIILQSNLNRQSLVTSVHLSSSTVYFGALQKQRSSMFILVKICRIHQQTHTLFGFECSMMKECVQE